MNVSDVEQRVAHIAAVQEDYEMAHGAEDDLHLDVLTAIAEGAPDAQELAEAAIKSATLDFPRYTA